MKTLVCGVDEAGRGPLAGPVYAAAVILPGDFPHECLDDSKKLSEKKRLEAETIIRSRALWGIAFSTHEEIDSVNILQASLCAMSRAVFKLLEAMGKLEEARIRVVVDGNKIPVVADPRILEIRAVVKADASVYEVMAASILAKCERDRVMVEYAKLYPEYGYEKHKGYPTPAHKAVCGKLGPSPIQRLSFRY
jgi:ribonuclease HII